MTQIDHIVDGIYRISTPPDAERSDHLQPVPDRRRASGPGPHGRARGIRPDPQGGLRGAGPGRARLRRALLFEGDECGGMEPFMAEAKKAQLVGSDMSAILSLTAFGVDFVDRVKGVRDGDVIDTGRHQLRFLETPHVHHWDSMMVFEESTKSLFPSDLYIQPGDQPAVVNEDLTAECWLLPRDRDLRPRGPGTAHVDRLEALQPEWVHAMHGGTLTGEVLPRFTKALREDRSPPGQDPWAPAGGACACR